MYTQKHLINILRKANKTNTEFKNKMLLTLRMKCACGKWNNVKTEKIFLELESKEPLIKVFLPSYRPLKTEVCKKRKTEIAEPKELIRINKN